MLLRKSLALSCCLLLAFGNLNCSVNILKTFSDTTSDGALFEDAMKAQNAGDYTGALFNISQMSGSYQATLTGDSIESFGLCRRVRI